MDKYPTGTVTFLFTDIEGSTKLAREHPAVWDAAQSRHHQILRRAIESHGGYVFQVIGGCLLRCVQPGRSCPASRVSCPARPPGGGVG